MPSNHPLRWKPFNSLIASNYLIKELDEKRTKHNMPCFNNDQLIEIGLIIKEKYEKEEIVKITYYTNEKYLNITGKIKKINENSKTIYINNQNISFYKIIKIN